MNNQYVEKSEKGYWVRGTRVSLDSIVYAFWRGETPESIAQSFPILKLEQVYGGIAYYLANKNTVDEYIKNSEKTYEAMRKEAYSKDPMFYKKLAEARRSEELM